MLSSFVSGLLGRVREFEFGTECCSPCCFCDAIGGHGFLSRSGFFVSLELARQETGSFCFLGCSSSGLLHFLRPKGFRVGLSSSQMSLP